MGAPSSDKTYVGCTLGMEACKQGFTVRFIRLLGLLEELAIARGAFYAIQQIVLNYTLKSDIILFNGYY